MDSLLKNGNSAAILALIDETKSLCRYCASDVQYDHDLERHVITAKNGTVMLRRCPAQWQRYRLAELFVEPTKS